MNGKVKVEKEEIETGKEEFEKIESTVHICIKCGEKIVDQFLLKINDSYWHESCLLCCYCCQTLNGVCFYKDGRAFCKDDYLRIHGCKCAGCEEYISPNELVMKALKNIYHIDCFKCQECGDRLEKGDEFILKENKLYCSADFNVAEQKIDIDIFSSDEYDSISTLSSNTSPNGQEDKTLNGPKRPRTILTIEQRENFKAAFNITPKPCRKVREQLSNETGLSVRVVQVWFQNQRAKLKKIQKKSGGNDIRDTEKITNITTGKTVKKKRSKSTSSFKSTSSSASECDLLVTTQMPFSQFLQTDINGNLQNMYDFAADNVKMYGRSLKNENGVNGGDKMKFTNEMLVEDFNADDIINNSLKNNINNNNVSNILPQSVTESMLIQDFTTNRYIMNRFHRLQGNILSQSSFSCLPSDPSTSYGSEIPTTLTTQTPGQFNLMQHLLN